MEASEIELGLIGWAMVHIARRIERACLKRQEVQYGEQATPNSAATLNSFCAAVATALALQRHSPRAGFTGALSAMQRAIDLERNHRPFRLRRAGAAVLDRLWCCWKRQTEVRRLNRTGNSARFLERRPLAKLSVELWIVVLIVDAVAVGVIVTDLRATPEEVSEDGVVRHNDQCKQERDNKIK